jgi:oligopeptide transport system ATP-binding protein
MYLGHIVEHAETEELHKHPLHPYTQALLSAIPVPDPRLSRRKSRIVLEGDVPSPASPPSGCVFRTRCRHAARVCEEAFPETVDAGGSHMIACHRWQELAGD